MFTNEKLRICSASWIHGSKAHETQDKDMEFGREDQGQRIRYRNKQPIRLQCFDDVCWKDIRDAEIEILL